MSFLKSFGWQIVGGVGILLFGMSLGGFLAHIQYDKNRSPIVFSPMREQIVPVLTLEKIENGVLMGKSNVSEFRLQTNENNILVFHDESFRMDITDILPLSQKIPAPEGSQFVASSRGKKYWALDTPEAALLTPKNRIFFKSAEEAQSKGYEAGKK
jgi:hypothetical protein